MAKSRTLMTAGEAGVAPVAKRASPAIYPQNIQQAPTNREFLDALTSEQGRELLQQSGLGYTPGLTMPTPTGVNMEDYLGGPPPTQIDPSYRGGLTGPEGEPLPAGAVAFDSYGRAYYGPGLAGYWKGVKARLFGDPNAKALEALMSGQLGDPDPTKEVQDIRSKYGTFDDWLKQGFVEGAGLIESSSSVKDALSGMLQEVGGGLRWAGDVWDNLRAGQFEVATAPAKVVQEAVNVVMEGFQQFDYVLESALAGSVTEYRFAKSTGKTTVDALWEGATAVFDPAARMAYTGLFNQAAYAELKREIAEGADPYLARQRWENPFVEMGGQIITGLVSGVAWSKAMKWLGLGKWADEIARGQMLADEEWIEALNKWRLAKKGANDFLPELIELTRARITKTADALEELASKRGWRTLTSGGKRAVHKEIVHDNVMYIVRETSKTVDGVRQVDPDEVADVLTKLARAHDGTDDSIKEFLGYVQTWSDGHNKAPEVLFSKNMQKTGKILHELLFDEGGRGEAWIRKAIQRADGDPEKLMKTLLSATETKLDKLFPSVMDVMKAEDVRKAQMVAAGLDYTPSREFKDIPAYMKRLGQFDEVVGKGIYGPINKFFASVYMGMSPGYAVRNHMTNMLHVWFDHGPFAMIRKEDDAIRLTQNWLGYLPEAAEKGFAGPVGAVLSREMLSREMSDMTFLQKVTSATSRWSQGFELKAARKVVAAAVEESMQKSIKAIMRSEDVLNALGPDIARRYGKELSNQLMQKYGNVEEVVKWFKETAQQGYYEAWKSMANLADEDVEMLRKFSMYDLEGKIARALTEATDAEDFAKRVTYLKDEIRTAVNQTMREHPMFSYDHGNAEDLSFIGSLVDDGVFADHDGAIFSARDISTSNAYNAAENAVDELGSQIREYLAITLSKMNMTKEEAHTVINKVWGPLKERVSEHRRLGNAEHQAALNRTRLMVDTIRETKEDVTNPAILNELSRLGMEYPSEGALGWVESIRFLWDKYRLTRKQAYGNHRTAAVNEVVEWFANFPAKLQSEEIAMGPLGSVIAEARAQGLTEVDLPRIAEEVENMVNNSVAMTRMQELETLASMWDEMDARKLAAFGGAYAQYPHAEPALEVFRRLGIPTASEGGAPFDLRTLQHMAQKGLDYAKGKNPDLDIVDFTVDEMMAAEKMQPERLKQLDTVLRGWFQDKLDGFGATVDEWLKPGKAGEGLAETEQRIAQVAANELRLAQTPEELLDVAKRQSGGILDWKLDEDGVLETGKLMQVLDDTDPRNTAGDGRWQILVSQEAMSGGLDPAFADVEGIFARADEFIDIAEEAGETAAGGIRRFGQVEGGPGGMMEELRKALKNVPPGKNPVQYVLSWGGLDADQQKALIRAVAEAAGETIDLDRDLARGGELLRDFLNEAFVAAAKPDTMRTTMAHEMAHVFERAFWGEWDALTAVPQPGSNLEKLHTLFGQFAPGDKRISAEGAEAFTETVIAMAKHGTVDDVVQEVARSGHVITEDHIRIIEEAINHPKSRNLKNMVQALVTPTGLEGLADFTEQAVELRGGVRLPISAFAGGTHDWAEDLNGKQRLLDTLIRRADADRTGRFGPKALFGSSPPSQVTPKDIQDRLTALMSAVYGGDKTQGANKAAQVMDDYHKMRLGDWQIWKAIRKNLSDEEAHAFMTTLFKDVDPTYRAPMLQDLATFRGTYTSSGWQFADATSTLPKGQLSLSRRPGEPILVEGLEDFGDDFEGMANALIELSQGDNPVLPLSADNVMVRMPNDLQVTASGDGYLTAIKMLMRKHFDDNPARFEKWWRNFLSTITAGEPLETPKWYRQRRLDSDTLTRMLHQEMGRSPISDPLYMPYSGGHTPSPARYMAENKDGLFRLLDRVSDGVKERYSAGAVTQFQASTEDVRRVEQWAKAVEPKMSQARAAAAEVAKHKREFTLLDYEKKRGYDMFFGYLFPYQFWYNRTYQNWFKHRLVNNAPVIGAYAAYRHGLEKIHAGMPEWWKYNVNTNELFGLDSENPLYFNLEATLNPLNGLTGVDFDNAELQRHWISRTLNDLAKFGPTVWTPFQLAAAAHLKWGKGDDQAAAAMAGRLFPQTAAIRALGALAGKDIELDPNVHIFSDGIEYYERRRIGRALAAMAQSGQITNAQAIQAAERRSGAVWDEAKMMALQDRAPGQLAAFTAGVGFKGRRQEEIVIDEYYNKRNAIIAQRENVRPDEYAQMWDQLRLEYPFMDTLILSKRPGEARDQALAYNTLGRIPPGQQDKWTEWAGIPDQLINKFYESKGKVAEWSESDRMRFMAGIVDLQAVLEVPPATTQAHWNAARSEYRLLNLRIEQQYGKDIDFLIDAYFDLKNEGSEEKAENFLQLHPQVEQAMDYRTQYILNQPVLNTYYGGIDVLERYYKSLMYDDARALFGEDIFDLQSTYFAIKDAGGNAKGFLHATSEEFGSHYRLTDYWDWNRAQKDIIAKRIADFGEDMQPLQEAVIRYDAAEDTLGTQAVMAGIFEENLANGMDPELTSTVLQWTTGTQQEESGMLPNVPAIPTSDYYLSVPYDYVSRFFSPTLRYRLDNHFQSGDPISPEGIRELQEVWLTLGRPGGNFSHWVQSYLPSQYMQGQNLPQGRVPQALP